MTIDHIGGRGDGVAIHQGRPLFVPLTVPGDRVVVRVDGRRGDGLAGTVRTMLAAGPDRAVAPCPHFGRCGGCLLQHVADAAYRRWKEGVVRRALAHHGLSAVTVAPLLALPAAGRRRATLAARRVGDTVVLGFHEYRGRRIADLSTCLVLVPALVALLAPLRAVLADVLRPGEAVAIAVAALDDGPDLVIAAVRAPDVADRERLADFAAAADLARLSWRLGDGPPDPVAHRRSGIVRFGAVDVVVPPGGFLQASAAGEEALTGMVLDGVGPAGAVADLFAGVGTFALPLSDRARVHAVDGDGAAIAALAAAARRAGRAGRIDAAARDLHRDPLSAAELARFDAVVFDPPRQGARAQAAELAGSAVPTVVGVSCNPASFARDAALLVAGGYRLDRVTPIDQFQWSPHVELVGTFRRP